MKKEKKRIYGCKKPLFKRTILVGFPNEKYHSWPETFKLAKENPFG